MITSRRMRLTASAWAAAVRRSARRRRKPASTCRRGLLVLLLAALASGTGAGVCAAQGVVGEGPRPPALHVRGLASAPVEIVEFCDFRSTACAELSLVLLSVVREFREQARVVFRHLPQEKDQGDATLATLAYRAALAASEQGRFWEMHDLLFANQERQSRSDMIGMARQLELDVRLFVAALDQQDWPAMADNQAEAIRLNVTTTPTVFVNGERAPSARALEDFRALVRAALTSR